jgi:hypothetical protein
MKVGENTKHLHKRKNYKYRMMKKLIVQQKNLAYKKYLRTKNIDNGIEYKSRRAIVKRETRQRHGKFWEQFM